MVAMKFVVLILAVLIGLSAAKKDSVPFFMWADHGVKQNNYVSAETIDSKQFSKAYLETLLKPEAMQNIVAFLQDSLTLEDITNYADVYNMEANGATFHNLKTLVEESNGLQLPSVSGMKDIIRNLKTEFSGKIHELKEPYNVDELPLHEGRNLIIAKLPLKRMSDAKVASDLKTNDEIMKRVTDSLKAKGTPVAAFYTGMDSANELNVANQGRHLLQVSAADKKNYTFFNASSENGQFMLYTSQMKVRLQALSPSTGKPINYTELEFPAFESEKPTSFSIKNGTVSVTMNFPQVTQNQSTIENFTVSMEFEEGNGIWSGEWKMTSMNATYTWKQDKIVVEETDMPMLGGDVFAPNSFSYHCTDFMYVSKNMSKQNATDYRFGFIMKKFQFQYSAESFDRFGRANDCVAFFTIPILSGIIAGLLLIMILFFGISMIASISTMDRFDDPKGKGITVNVSE